MFVDSDLTRVPHEEFRQRGLLVGRDIAGVSTDSRSIQSGELYVALRGERFDGHAFVADAFARGAAAAVVDSRCDLRAFPRMPLLVVANTLDAYGALAALHRSRFRIPVLAVAGSNGKTTTKEMIAAVLGTTHRVLSTQANHNNAIGVAQTLLRLRTEHTVAVVELGTNHPGELEVLLSVARPTHGVVTNIGSEHLEFFGTIEGVALEEGMLLRWLARRRSGIAFVNADDPRIAAAARSLRGKVTYGFSAARTTVRGSALTIAADGCAHFAFRGARMVRSVPVTLRVPGRHNASNALAAASIGGAFRVPARRIAEALGQFDAVDKRMEVVRRGGVTVINDAYNANPDSTLAALATLAALQVPGKRIAVLADMLELGAATEEEHRRIGREAARLGIGFVLTFGSYARHINDGAQGAFAVHYEQKNMLAEYLAELVAPGDAVLVKGSRGMHMDDVVTFLVQRLDASQPGSRERKGA